MASEGPGVLRKLGVAVLNATLMLAALVLLLAVLLVWQVRGLAQDMRGGLRAELATVQPRIEGARETARQALEAVDDARSRPAADTTELTAVRDSLRALIEALGRLETDPGFGNEAGLEIGRETGDETESLIRQLVLAIFATAARGLLEPPQP